MGRRGKEAIPEGADASLPFVPLAIGRRIRALKHTVLGHGRDYGVNIVLAEGIAQALNSFKRGFREDIVIRAARHGCVPSFCRWTIPASSVNVFRLVTDNPCIASGAYGRHVGRPKSHPLGPHNWHRNPYIDAWLHNRLKPLPPESHGQILR